MTVQQASVIAFSGGVGGAKLSLGLQRVLELGALTVVVNTGDDFEYLGLNICPDLDTTLYTLAAVSNEQQGWGRAEESWHAMRELERVGAPTWFKLGDKDLAVHLERTRRLTLGEPLSSITADFTKRFGVRTAIVPMSDDTVRTLIDTDMGVIEFQDYFVRRKCAPRVRAISYRGATSGAVPMSARAAMQSAHLRAVVFCPPNPFLSIDPILALPAWRALLQQTPVPVVAVSPIVAGNAVKGPTRKIMDELAVASSPGAIAEHYAGIIDGLVIDRQDAELAHEVDIPVYVTDTLMVNLGDRERLARETLRFADTLTSTLSRSPPGR